MKSPQEIIQTISDENSKFAQKRATVGVIRGIIDDAKDFLDKLAKKIADSINQNSFSVKVENQIKLPETQKIDGSVSIKDMRSLIVGLDEVIKALNEVKNGAKQNAKTISNDLKPEKIDFSSLEKAIKAIKFPDIKIPEQRKTVEVSNFNELKKYFDLLVKKFVVPAPVVNVPPFPKEIAVSNFPKPEKPIEPEKMSGFYWEKDKNGDVTTLVEKYPSGEIVSSCWNIGSVKIDDRRT